MRTSRQRRTHSWWLHPNTSLRAEAEEAPRWPWPPPRPLGHGPTSLWPPCPPSAPQSPGPSRPAPSVTAHHQGWPLTSPGPEPRQCRCQARASRNQRQGHRGQQGPMAEASPVTTVRTVIKVSRWKLNGPSPASSRRRTSSREASSLLTLMVTVRPQWPRGPPPPSRTGSRASWAWWPTPTLSPTPPGGWR